MRNWEYEVLSFEAKGLFQGSELDIQKYGETINRFGSEGWEVISVMDTNYSGGETHQVIVTFKRPID